jgi:hypothetical protein
MFIYTNCLDKTTVKSAWKAMGTLYL